MELFVGMDSAGKPRWGEVREGHGSHPRSAVLGLPSADPVEAEAILADQASISKCLTERVVRIGSTDNGRRATLVPPKARRGSLTSVTTTGAVAPQPMTRRLMPHPKPTGPLTSNIFKIDRHIPVPHPISSDTKQDSKTSYSDRRPVLARPLSPRLTDIGSVSLGSIVSRSSFQNQFGSDDLSECSEISELTMNGVESTVLGQLVNSGDFTEKKTIETNHSSGYLASWERSIISEMGEASEKNIPRNGASARGCESRSEVAFDLASATSDDPLESVGKCEPSFPSKWKSMLDEDASKNPKIDESISGGEEFNAASSNHSSTIVETNGSASDESGNLSGPGCIHSRPSKSISIKAAKAVDGDMEDVSLKLATSSTVLKSSSSSWWCFWHVITGIWHGSRGDAVEQSSSCPSALPLEPYEWAFHHAINSMRG